MANKDKNISMIEQAVVELQSIVEAADKSAKDKMAKKLPEEFEKLLKEELENNKKESVEESVEDVTKEPVNEGEKTDDDKESLNEMNEIDLSELSIEDIEEAYNEASSSDEFEVSPDEINIDDVEKELEEMSINIDSMQQEGDNPSDPFDQIKNLHKMLGEMIQDNEMKNEMHEKVPHGVSSNPDKGHNTTPSGINEDVSPELIQGALGALGTIAGAGGLALLQQKAQGTKVGQFLSKLGSAASGGIKGGATSMGESEEMMNENVSPEMIQGALGILTVLAGAGGLVTLEQKIKGTKIGQMLAQAGSAASSGIRGGATSMGESVVESEEVVAEAEEVIDEVDAASEDKAEVDEKHGVGYSDGKVRAGTLPNDGAEYRDRKGHSRNRPQWSNESVEKFMAQKETMEKRMNSLIEENKKMTKKMNESKVKEDELTKLSEEHDKFKETLVKYRDQLSEMAIFNTNLAGVNSILVNENLALTNEDKKEIINKFKNVKSITESEDTYRAVLAEMHEAKKTITESVEEKVTTTVDKSASEKVVEQTAYVNEHVNKIKDMMKYVDNHGNKKILR